MIKYHQPMTDTDLLFRIMNPLALRCKMLVELCYQCVGIGAVNSTSLLDSLTSRSGAAQTVHTYLQEQGCNVKICIEDIADNSVLINRICHFKVLLFVTLRLFYNYNRFCRKLQ